MARFRVIEQLMTVTEISFDVTAPDADTVEDHLNYGTDEVFRQTVRSQREIISVKPLDESEVP